jgi:hypothetical protein
MVLKGMLRATEMFLYLPHPMYILHSKITQITIHKIQQLELQNPFIHGCWKAGKRSGRINGTGEKQSIQINPGTGACKC